MKNNTKEKLVIIDANALVHRAYHALPPLSSQKGELTNAVFGFASLLIKVIKDINPDYMVACFDLPEPTFRHKEFEEYKAHREKTPEDLIVQFDKVKEVLKAFGIPIFEKPRYEADDLLGTIANLVKKTKKDIQIIILTGDLDTLQLVDDNVFVYTLKKGISDTILYDKKSVKERYGIEPNQMTDYKGLVGDPSDNIPGVSGIGQKTASSLLQEYGTLEQIYKNISLIPKKQREKLEASKDMAFFSKQLATICQDVDINFNLKDAKFGNYDKKKVASLFEELNFFTLLSRLDLPSKKSSSEKKVVIKKTTPKECKKKLKSQKSCAFFVDEDNQISICFGKTEIYTFNFEEAGFLFEDDKVLKIGFDIKRLAKNFLDKKINPKSFFDIKIASWLLSSGVRNYDLRKIILSELSLNLHDDKLKKLESYFIFLAKDKLEAKLKENKLLDLFFDIEMPIVFILAEMEKNGIKADTKKLKSLSLTLEKILKQKEKNIYKLAGEEFNINSPSQLGPILFDKLKIQKNQKVKKTKTGSYATGEQELEKYKDNHKIVKEILEYREIFKLKTTYVDALPKLVNKKTGRIHTTYNQTATSTGRLSSSDPNLQNIPQKGEFSKDIREAFLAEEGFSLVSFDYSQIELRIAAHLSSDEKMIEIFKKGGDFHTKTAMEINGVSEKDVTPKMRRMAKVLNFGILFGMGAKGFADAAEIEYKEAKSFIEEYFKKFLGLKEFLEKSVKDAEKTGYVKTETGRKRWLPDIKSKNWILKNAAERMAQNMPIQGLEADILKIAMINIQENIIKAQKNNFVKMILQVHDELVFEIKDDIIEGMQQNIKKEMENAYNLKVPLIVDVSLGKNWGSMQKIS